MLKRGILICVLLLAGLTCQVAASPSFLQTVSFPHGVEIAAPLKKGDPARLRLTFAPATQTDVAPEVAREKPFAFYAVMDTQHPVCVAPQHIAEMPLFEEMLFKSAEGGILDTVEVIMPAALVVTMDDAAFTSGNISRQSDENFTQQHLAAYETPEPTTLLLMGLGLMGLIGSLRRKTHSG